MIWIILDSFLEKWKKASLMLTLIWNILLKRRVVNKKVIEIVRKYVEKHLDKSGQKQEYDVYVVWQCYILGNAKWLLSTTLPDDMYYEVTYNKVKDEFYLDAYKKFENRCIPNK